MLQIPTVSSAPGLRILAGAAAAALTLIAFSPAFAEPLTVTAEPDTEVRSALVRYDDLNLASAAGQSRLQVRIRGAVRKVCPDERRLGLEVEEDERRCRTQATADASSQAELAVRQARAGYAAAGAIRITAR